MRSEAIARHLREDPVVAGWPRTAIKDAELADRLGVTITPVRESIVLLSAEGLIELAELDPLVTAVSQKNVLELIDVMGGAGLRGAEMVPNPTGADLAGMRQSYEMLACERRAMFGGDLRGGAKFSTIMTGQRDWDWSNYVDLVGDRTAAAVG